MTNNQMIDMAKTAVVAYHNDRIGESVNFVNEIDKDDALIVWFCKTIQNWKALVTTTAGNGFYYEVTCNGDEKNIHLDVYRKYEKWIMSI